MASESLFNSLIILKLHFIMGAELLISCLLNATAPGIMAETTVGLLCRSVKVGGTGSAPTFRCRVGLWRPGWPRGHGGGPSGTVPLRCFKTFNILCIVHLLHGKILSTTAKAFLLRRLQPKIRAYVPSQYAFTKTVNIQGPIMQKKKNQKKNRKTLNLTHCCKPRVSFLS